MTISFIFEKWCYKLDPDDGFWKYDPVLATLKKFDSEFKMDALQDDENYFKLAFGHYSSQEVLLC